MGDTRFQLSALQRRGNHFKGVFCELFPALLGIVIKTNIAILHVSMYTISMARGIKGWTGHQNSYQEAVLCITKTQCFYSDFYLSSTPTVLCSSTSELLAKVFKIYQHTKFNAFGTIPIGSLIAYCWTAMAL